VWVLALVVCLGAAPSDGRAEERQLLPEWDYEAGEDTSKVSKAAGTTASETYSFINDTLSDTWSITTSPTKWGWRGWLAAGAVAGVTTGMIYLVDQPVRRMAQGNEGFRNFGEGIRPLGNGAGLIALTGTFGLVGLGFDRPKERETARLLLEASASGFVFNIAGKWTLGRIRPRDSEGRGPRQFEPFSGNVSMPSGEATSAFVMAGVITSQYPSWPVQLTAYSLATAIGLGRIAVDAHWASDVFVSAVLGIAVSKAVVHFHRKRQARRRRREALLPETRGRPEYQRHFVQLSPRAFRWTYVW
jgi:membrane-associated phospholipid phosphatase